MTTAVGVPDCRRATLPLWATLVVALPFLGGCPKPLLVARPHAPPTAAILADALSERQAVLTAMNARVRATSWLGGDRVRATVLMLVDRPGRLRFEAEVSLQGTVAVLATDGQRFAFLDTMKNELRRGPACAANVASLIRIPLAPADVAAMLLGDMRLPAGTTVAGAVVDWDPSQRADVLAVRRNDGWLRVLFQGAPPNGGRFSMDGLRVVGAIATGADGRPRWRVAFEDFAKVSVTGPSAGAPAVALWLPQTIRFAEGASSFDEGVEIKVKERSLNEPLADSAFVLPAPIGTSVIEVGCPPSLSTPRPARSPGWPTR